MNYITTTIHLFRKMNVYNLFSSGNCNQYFLDRKSKQVLLINPEFRKFLAKLSGGAKIDFDELNDDEKYYLSYFEFLKEQNFFSIQKGKDFHKEFTTSIVEDKFFNSRLIIFEATERCNLRCKYCCYSDLYKKISGRENRSQTLTNAITFLEYVFESEAALSKRIRKDFFISFYGGEPLLNFNFINDIVQYSKNLSTKLGLTIRHSLTTNGILLDKYMDFLVSNNFEILISLDGDEYSTSYRTFTNGQPAYQSIFQNAKLLKNKYPDFFKKNVNFSAVLHNRNSIKGVIDFFEHEFEKPEPLISPLNRNYVNETNKNEFDHLNSIETGLTDSPLHSLENMNTNSNHPIYRRMKDFINNFSNNYFTRINQFLVNEMFTKDVVHTGTCLPFQLKIYVNAKGDIFTCEKIGEEFSLGAIKNNKIQLDFKQIAQSYNNFFKNIFKLCQNCENFQTCGKCAFLIENGEICDRFMSRKEFIKSLSESMTILENHDYLLEMTDQENQDGV